MAVTELVTIFSSLSIAVAGRRVPRCGLFVDMARITKRFKFELQAVAIAKRLKTHGVLGSGTPSGYGRLLTLKAVICSVYFARSEEYLLDVHAENGVYVFSVLS